MAARYDQIAVAFCGLLAIMELGPRPVRRGYNQERVNTMTTQKSKLPVRMLVISLAIVLCFSFLACLFNTGMFSTNVSRIRFDTANGQLSGLLYMPKGASASAPRTAVIVTHGSRHGRRSGSTP